MMEAACLMLALLLVGLTALYWHEHITAGRMRRRESQLIDLCNLQQGWIRRGEIACHDCPELGCCVVLRSCQREHHAATRYVPPPMTGAAYLPAQVRFIQE